MEAVERISSTRVKDSLRFCDHGTSAQLEFEDEARSQFSQRNCAAVFSAVSAVGGNCLSFIWGGCRSKEVLTGFQKGAY